MIVDIYERFLKYWYEPHVDREALVGMELNLFLLEDS